MDLFEEIVSFEVSRRYLGEMTFWFDRVHFSSLVWENNPGAVILRNTPYSKMAAILVFFYLFICKLTPVASFT